MSMRVTPVVNSILQLGFQNQTADLTHLKVQNLLYFLNGWHLAMRGTPAIDEHFEAWPHGPVVPSLYRMLKPHGDAPIHDYIPEWDETRQKSVPRVVSIAITDFWEVLMPVWEKYSQLTPLQLSTLAQQPGSPWDQTLQASPIQNDLIRSHFLVLAGKTASASQQLGSPSV